MLPFIFRRLVWLVPTLLCVLLITFVIMHATPGGPWDTNPNTRVSDPALASALDRQFGLDKPLLLNTDAASRALRESGNPLTATQALFDSQLFAYASNLAQGNLGPSYRFRGRSVQDLLLAPEPGRAFWQNRITATLLLGLGALLLAILIGVPLGLAAGVHPNSWMDRLGVVTATVGYAIPNFVMGLLLIFIFSVWLDLMPVIENDDWGSWQPWVLPIIALALPTAAFLARLTRASVVEIVQQDYVRTARAKGLRESTILARHILRNALMPIVTFMGPALAALVGGSYIVESQFGVNGIGVLFVDSIGARDYGVILALTLFYALVIALANLAVDVLYGFLDPRLRSGGRTV